MISSRVFPSRVFTFPCVRVLSRPVSASPAFTLIELLTVIAIIGILAAIIIPTVGKVRQTAIRSQCASNLRQNAMAYILYANDNKGRIPRQNPDGATNCNKDTLNSGQSLYLGSKSTYWHAPVSVSPVALKNSAWVEKFRAPAPNDGFFYWPTYGPFIDYWSWTKMIECPLLGFDESTLQEVPPSKAVMLGVVNVNQMATLDAADNPGQMNLKSGAINGTPSRNEDYGSDVFNLAFFDGHVSAIKGGTKAKNVILNTPTP
jgi:prepilin-type N-terminal cleavage/methylation domain-containing protein/prepilin-type processing-associated H-X9-DG protein